MTGSEDVEMKNVGGPFCSMNGGDKGSLLRRAQDNGSQSVQRKNAVNEILILFLVNH